MRFVTMACATAVLAASLAAQERSDRPASNGSWFGEPAKYAEDFTRWRRQLEDDLKLLDELQLYPR